jgi:hypothetical protein
MPNPKPPKLAKYFVPTRQTDALPERQAKAMGVKPYALNPPTANESYKRFVKPHALPVKMNGGGEMRGTNDDNASPKEEHFGRPKNTTEVGSPYNNSSAASNAQHSPNLMVPTFRGYADGGNVADEYVGHKMSEGGVADMEAERNAYAAARLERQHAEANSPDKIAAGAAQARLDAAAPPPGSKEQVVQALSARQQAQDSINNAFGTGSSLEQLQRGANLSGPAFNALQAQKQAETPPPGYAQGGRIMGSPSLSPEALDSLRKMIPHPNTTQKYADGGAVNSAPQFYNSPYPQSQLPPMNLAQEQQGGVLNINTPPNMHNSPLPSYANGGRVSPEHLKELQNMLPHPNTTQKYADGGSVSNQYVGHKMADGGEVPPELLKALVEQKQADIDRFKGGFTTESGKTGGGTRMAHGGNVADEYVGHRMSEGGEAPDDLGSLLKGLPKGGSKTIVIKGGNMSPEDEQSARRATMDALQHMMNALQEEDEDSVNEPSPKAKKKK